MTLLYTLFGMPGNEQEFMDRMKRKGISNLDILVDETIQVCKDGQSVVYQCFPVLWADGIRLNLKEYSRKRVLPDTNDGELEKLNMQDRNFKRVLQLADDYQRDFTVTIVGKSVDEAKDIFKRHHLQQMAKLTQEIPVELTAD